ncbi:transcriptional regulator TACO1-like protein [Vararia minispora EC-137]|uniref:Transcriptional regulator TACO1-like protein n=1 Tax=Vararia minispora EC-137 TaxID=1314806 RepID=A0ACB8QE35_9AGAM|nr:transcriptional regulator TACO1-like protein [Vararia minispora EC-137]
MSALTLPLHRNTFQQAWTQTYRKTLHTTASIYSGHNKWSKIKGTKGVNDAEKGRAFSQVTKDIVVAVRTNGSTDTSTNLALAQALQRAKKLSVPKTTIERALAKASGEKAGGAQSTVFEAIAHGTVGIMVESLTDNLRRTVAYVNDVLNSHKYGCARAGKVDYLFDRKGIVRVNIECPADDDLTLKIVEDAISEEAEDFNTEPNDSGTGTVLEFICPPASLSRVTKAATHSEEATLLTSELVWRPKEPVEVDEEIESSVAELVEKLDDLDDTLRVWTSLDR